MKYYKFSSLVIALVLSYTTCLQAQNAYFGPQGMDGSKGYVFVEVSVFDSEDSQLDIVDSVSFDGRNIPLKPRGINGFRGKASFQKKPGAYSLSWSVNQQSTWPKSTSLEKTVNISPRDFSIEITIQGNEAKIE